MGRLVRVAGRDRLPGLVLPYTGLRSASSRALRVRRVDLLLRRLDIAETVTELGDVMTFGTPLRLDKTS